MVLGRFSRYRQKNCFRPVSYRRKGEGLLPPSPTGTVVLGCVRKVPFVRGPNHPSPSLPTRHGSPLREDDVLKIPGAMPVTLAKRGSMNSRRISRPRFARTTDLKNTFRTQLKKATENGVCLRGKERKRTGKRAVEMPGARGEPEHCKLQQVRL